MQSAENKGYLDSKSAVRLILKHALLELANRIKQVHNNFINHVLQEVFRKVWQFLAEFNNF